MRLRYDYQDTPKKYYKTIDTLQDLEHYILNDLDHPLKHTAFHTVFSNHTTSPIMLIGEAPGEEEDKAGEPFVGRSGQLLMNVFASIGLSREQLYITNLIPWRPANNRTPLPHEMEFFLPLLKKHILLKNPSIIILLGGVVTKALFSKKTEISKIRGKILTLTLEEKTFPVLPTFHPAYLMRSPRMKKLAWEDMLQLAYYLKHHP